tara:strand:- start:196 stop:609 length:414 start_codon:yes stop_codon:yes gene_type:complete
MDKRFIQNTLEDLLNINLRVEYTEYESQEDNDRVKEEKKIFSKIMSRLEKLKENENKIYDQYGMSIEAITEPYWDTIEDLIDFMYMDECADVIWWYIHDRKTITGTIHDWEDEEDGKSYTFNTPSDLFDYIAYKYKS